MRLSLFPRCPFSLARSKTEVAMKNEALCKILAHNLCCLVQAMHGSGIQPDFAQMPLMLPAN